MMKVRKRQSNVTLFHDGQLNKPQPDIGSGGKFYSNGKKHYNHKDAGLESNGTKEVHQGSNSPLQDKVNLSKEEMKLIGLKGTLKSRQGRISF